MPDGTGPKKPLMPTAIPAATEQDKVSEKKADEHAQ
jgi:hypothetical protein